MHAREREREAASLLRVSNTGEAPFSRKTFLFRRAQNARDSTRFELAGARRSTTRLSLALFNNYSQGCRCVETLCARVYACIDIYTLWSGKTSRDKWNRCLGREGCQATLSLDTRVSRSMLIVARSLLIRHPEIEYFSSSPEGSAIIPQKFDGRNFATLISILSTNLFSTKRKEEGYLHLIILH